jgi:REP element-mobilizing transposase RayT
MSDKYKNKYRIPSSRLIGWDYGWNSCYFVTICTQNRTCFFGDVINEQMVLNDIGLLANDFWLQIPEKFPFAKLHNHVIMPNHMHGIIIIDKQYDAHVQTRFEQTQLIASLQDNADVQTRFIASPLSNADESTQSIVTRPRDAAEGRGHVLPRQVERTAHTRRVVG